MLYVVARCEPDDQFEVETVMESLALKGQSVLKDCVYIVFVWFFYYVENCICKYVEWS
jgi:hypothetical protein